jgi:hypothetical protein
VGIDRDGLQNQWSAARTAPGSGRRTPSTATGYKQQIHQYQHQQQPAHRVYLRSGTQYYIANQNVLDESQVKTASLASMRKPSDGSPMEGYFWEIRKEVNS